MNKQKTLRNLNTIHMLNDGFVTALPLLLPFIAADFGMNLTQVGFLGSLQGALMVFLALPSAYVAIKIGSFRTIGIVFALYGIGYIATGISPSLLFVTLSFLVASLGFGTFHPVAFALVAKLADKSERGRLMANFTAVGDIGRIFFASATPFVATYIGWRTTSVASGFIALGVFVAIFLLFKKRVGDTISAQKSKVSIAQIVKNKHFLMVNAAGILDTTASHSLFLFIPFLLLYRGLDIAFIGIFSALFFVGNFSGKTILGRLVDHYGSKRVFIASEIGMAITIVLLANTASFIAIGIFATVLGAFTKGTAPVVQTMVSESVSKHHEKDDKVFSKAFGLRGIVSGVAVAISPLLLGAIADQTSIIWAFNVSAVIALLATIPAAFIKKS